MAEKKFEGRGSHKSSHAHDVSQILAEKWGQTIKWVSKHRTIAGICGGLVLVVIIGLMVLLLAPKKEEATQTLTAETMDIEIPQEPLDRDAFPAVNALMDSYYQALSAGDADLIASIDNQVDDTDRIRIEETGKYIDSYSNMEVYTKKGPLEDTYLAYVYTKVRFSDYDAEIPGMQSFYICKDEEGTYYINESDVSDEEMEYIMTISLQDDVIDLNNRITVEYNDMVAADTELNNFLAELNTQIQIAVGERLAAEASEEVEEAEVESTNAEENESATEPEEPSPKTAVTTTTINVRSSDSETADKVGKLPGGSVVTILESRQNGWSRIVYENGEAFVKSDYVEIKVEAQSAVGVATNGTVTAKENVNIRIKPSETADKLGVASGGDKLDLIEKQSDGWTKIKYNNQIAYVKSEFVQ